VATILSAQCTDKRVNEVTPALFMRFPRAADYLSVEPAELEEMIRPTGFFRNKTRAIRQASAEIVERHGGEVPDSFDDLVALHGVGRKTAAVVASNAFGLREGIAWTRTSCGCRAVCG
jgi:endonuclease-3